MDQKYDLNVQKYDKKRLGSKSGNNFYLIFFSILWPKVWAKSHIKCWKIFQMLHIDQILFSKNYILCIDIRYRKIGS